MNRNYNYNYNYIYNYRRSDFSSFEIALYVCTLSNVTCPNYLFCPLFNMCTRLCALCGCFFFNHINIIKFYLEMYKKYFQSSKSDFVRKLCFSHSQ